MNWKFEFINKKKFAKWVMDENIELYIVYVASITLEISIYLN